MERPVGCRNEDVDPEVERRQRRRKQPQYEEPPPPFPHPNRFILVLRAKSNRFAHLLAQQAADAVDLGVQLAPFGGKLPFLLRGDGVRKAREPLVQLDSLCRDGTRFVLQLHELRPQFSFVHPVSVTGAGTSQSVQMSSSELPDLDQIAMRLVQLRHRAQDLTRLLERSEERHYQFPSDHSQKTLDDLRAEDAALRAEIVQLEEQIRPLLRRPEEP